MIKYEKDNATVLVNWTQVNSALYYANITPQVPVTFTTNTSIELIVPYNSPHNLSVNWSLCDQDGTPAVIDLNIGGFKSLLQYFHAYYNILSPIVKCDNLTHLLDDSLIYTNGYHYPALEGTNVTFSCPAEQVLTGPDSSSCMENGEWEPDPRDVECKGDIVAKAMT